MDIEVHEIASSAVLSAVSILRTVVLDSEIQSYLNGLPTYFHVMIAFAVVFLLKVTTRFSASVHPDTQELQRLMVRLVEVLQDVSKTMHPHHLLVTITDCIRDVIQRNLLAPTPLAGTATGSSPQRPAQASGDSELEQSSLVAEERLDEFFFNEYDFLVNNVQEPGFEI